MRGTWGRCFFVSIAAIVVQIAAPTRPDYERSLEAGWQPEYGRRNPDLKLRRHRVSNSVDRSDAGERSAAGTIRE
jgi:hypothetical protein